MKIIPLITFSILTIFIGCKSNPYPESGGQIVEGQAPVKRDVVPAIIIDVKDRLIFKEGQKSAYDIKYNVPTNDPVISFEGLPKRMQFEEKTKQLIWKPEFTDANDPNDLKIKVKQYRLKIWVRSENNPIMARSKEIAIIVEDNPRAFKFEGNSTNTYVTEGRSIEREFDIINEDFPDGPFRVKTFNLPSGFLVSANETKISLKFAPSYEFVNVLKDCPSSWSCKVTFDKGKIVVVAPDERELEIPFKLQVDDKRNDASIFTPDQIEQGLDGSFTVSAVDLNKEIEPKIELVSKPFFGEITMTKLETNEDNPYQSFYRIDWKNIPESSRGRNADFRIKACVLNSSQRQTNCDYQAIRASVSLDNKAPPVFDRTEWPMGHIKFLKVGGKNKYPLEISDGDDKNRSIQNIEIFPKSVRKIVSYSTVINRLIIEPETPGLVQFTVVARSIYGKESSESFAFEALPEEWSKNLTFVTSKRSNESIKTSKLFDTLDMANLDFQKLDGRLLSERQTLILGTDILQNIDQLNLIESKLERFKNIILMSPLLSSLKGELAKEIGSLGVTLEGRFDEVVQGNLSDHYLIAGKGVVLTSPRRKVGLQGTLTNESKNPLIFTKSEESQCVSALTLVNDNNDDERIMSLRCLRANGGFILINGFEFGDLKMGSDEEDIPKTWLEEITNLKEFGEQRL